MSTVQQREELPVHTCAEMKCLQVALSNGIAVEKIRIKQAAGADGDLRAEPCENCSQWLEEVGCT